MSCLTDGSTRSTTYSSNRGSDRASCTLVTASDKSEEVGLTGLQRNLFVASRQEELMKFNPIPRRIDILGSGDMLAGFDVLLGAEIPTSKYLRPIDPSASS